MKKVLLMGLAAAAMLASCSNDETVEMAQQKAIGFSNAFVSNGTRSVNDPSFTNDKANLKDFAVFGFTQNGQIFTNTKVYKGGNASTGWSYDQLQFWVPGNTYTFGAIAPYSEGANVSGAKIDGTKVGMTVAFTNNGTTDLLHAAPAQVTDVTADYKTPVPLTFAHQLSKVKFSFENGVGTGYNVKVTNVKITDAKQTGTLTIANNAENVWSAQTGSVELAFGDAKTDDANSEIIANAAEMESYNEMLMIPTDATATYTVTFTAELLQGEVSMGTFNHSTTISGVELKLGYCYDFKATLNHENIVDPENPLKPIEFTVDDITDWNNGGESDVDVPATGN